MYFHFHTRRAPRSGGLGDSGIPAAICCIIALLVTVGHPDLGDPRPLSPPPEILQKAGQAVSEIIYDVLWPDDHDKFLSDGYWPCALNNSTVMVT